MLSAYIYLKIKGSIMTKRELEKRVKELKLKAQKRLAEAKAERTLRYMSTDAYVNNIAKELTIDKLDSTLRLIESAYYNLEDRKVVHTYGYGLLLDKVITICSNLKYLPREEKEAIFISTGLNDMLIEDLLEAVGRPSYYSKLNHSIVPEVEFDAEKTAYMLETLSITLDLDIDLNYDKDRIKDTFERARNKAESMFNATEEMLNTLKLDEELIKYEE
jgi:hypothetical protein